ncbi:MAG: hydrogenase nickel incorporation protein HypB [bacterium]|jgi:hydrogenase nickel incorporation protein HypB
MVTVKVMRAVNEENDLVATEVRQMLADYRVVALNLMSSPGSGKTSLLERTLDRMGGEWRFGAIVGDLFTTRDADRLAARGVPVVQLNTEGSCHLTAHMIRESLQEFDKDALDCLFIENVGNLVCPGGFDLGEDYRIAVLSTTEGGDKVEKYPRVFRQASASVITKTDLLEYLDFDLADVIAHLQLLNPEAPVFPLSTKTGEGMEDWCTWLRDLLAGAASTSGV